MYRIALEMLTADRARFIGIILGIASAALLITQQASIFFGLLSRAHAAIDDIPQVADLVDRMEREYRAAAARIAGLVA